MAQTGGMGRGLAFLAAGVLTAWPPDPSAAEPAAPAAPAPPAVRVSVAAVPDGMESTIDGAVVIAAPLCAVWTVLSKCENAPKIIPNVKRCRVIERDPARGRWEVRELVGGHPLLPKVRRSVVRSEFAPQQRIEFAAIEGDIKSMKGYWALEQVDDQTTRAIYHGVGVTPIRAPKPLVRMVARSDMVRGMTMLRREATTAPCEGGRPAPVTATVQAAK